MEEIRWLRRARDLVFQYKEPVEGDIRTESTTGLERWERFCFFGEYRHCYVLNTDYLGRDFSNEARNRANSGHAVANRQRGTP